ncbi:MAG TPA: proton-conducting transporter membrane subunit [Candidatus Bathyarchaeia archaeon]|nr:proton-conducting transporter membrane subunit [Candidatus Bathyarchaeia archaeon]
MIQFILGIFASGALGIVATLLLDLLVKRWSFPRSFASGVVSSLTYLAFLFLAWNLWEDIGVGGVQSVSVDSTPLGSTLVVGTLGLYVFGIAAILGLIISIYSTRYLARYRNAALFNSLLILVGLSVFGVVVAGDLLTLFIFWEAMSICAYGLVAFRKNQWDALEAGIKYLVLAGAGSITALLGIALVYNIAGTLNLQTLANLGLISNTGLLLALALIVSGFGVEAAIVPLHTWLPDAYPAAPSPASALLSGIVTAIGSFTIIRIIAGSFLTQSLINTLQPILVVLAVLTMLIGNLSAFGQDDIKRLLAFSSVAQVGYIMLGISTFSAAGISASIFHIWNNAFLKSLFFLLAGIVTFIIGTRNLKDMAGIARKSPIIGVLVSANALAMTGVPPFGLFWSEFLIVLSSIQIGRPLLTIGAVIMLLNIAFSIAYYFRIIRRITFDQPSDYLTRHEIRPSSALMLAPCIVLLAISLLTGFFPDTFYQPVLTGVNTLLGH